MSKLVKNDVEKILDCLQSDDITLGDLANIECVYSDDVDKFVQIVKENMELFLR